MSVDFRYALVEYCRKGLIYLPIFNKKMKKIILFAMVLAIALGSCKKTNKSGSKSSNSQMAGFWTFKTDPNMRTTSLAVPPT